MLVLLQKKEDIVVRQESCEYKLTWWEGISV